MVRQTAFFTYQMIVFLNPDQLLLIFCNHKCKFNIFECSIILVLSMVKKNSAFFNG